MSPVRHVQRRRCARQHVVAQGPQHLGQVAEQDLGGGVVLARAVTAHQRDQPVGGGAFGVEVVEGRAGRSEIGGIGHELGFGAERGVRQAARVVDRAGGAGSG
ncbi:MAG: hypothetical protein F9K25_20555 [Candidatus Contendobacter sp.]|nr:MAG: hypothetical protein F9K25_20555 [Candidatus Contendobacter sp.]